MSPRIKALLTQVGSFAIAGVLLYLSLRGVSLKGILSALEDADYRWLLPLFAALMLSHWLRAWRWKMLLDALPDVRDRPTGVSTKLAFYSVLIGYMVNYAAPRLGEVARSANLATRARVSFSRVLGTVVVERILDVVVLAAGLLSVVFLLRRQLRLLGELFVDPLTEQLGRIPAFGLLFLIGLVSLLLVMLYRRLVRSDSRIKRFWSGRVQPVLSHFGEGLSTLLRTDRRPAIVLSTLGIWFCYLLMAYLPLVMLGIARTYNLSLPDAWSIMLLGAIGVALPSPGGVGSYHYITIQTLVHLFGTDEQSAATYAVLAHAAQLIIMTLAGFISLLLQGGSFKTLARQTSAAREKETGNPA